MDDDQQFCLRWNNHQSTLISVFDTLLENETLVDCTLAAEGKFLKAHKVVLSACSPYFATLLQEQYDKHPIFILKDVKYQELRAMMDYMYRGEVNISQDQLAALLKAAESLQIKGLSDNRSGSTGGIPPKPDHHRGAGGSNVSTKMTGGYTLEQTKRARIGPSSMDSQDMSGSREGSSSPSRRRRKVRRRSIDNVMAEIHDNSNSSQIQANQTSSILQQQQQSNASLAGVGAITAAASALAASQIPTAAALSIAGTSAAAAAASATIAVNQGTTQQQQQLTASITKKTESSVKGTTTATSADASNTADNIQGAVGGNDEQDAIMDAIPKVEKQNHKQKSIAASKDTTVASSELVIEPKSEYDDEGNDETVEDLTLDDEDMGMDDLDHNAGTSQGGEGSSQGYAPWQHDRSQDELLLATQEAQQRDPQDLSRKISQLHKENTAPARLLHSQTQIQIQKTNPRSILNTATRRAHSRNSLIVEPKNESATNSSTAADIITTTATATEPQNNGNRKRLSMSDVSDMLLEFYKANVAKAPKNDQTSTSTNKFGQSNSPTSAETHEPSTIAAIATNGAAAGVPVIGEVETATTASKNLQGDEMVVKALNTNTAPFHPRIKYTNSKQQSTIGVVREDDLRAAGDLKTDESLLTSIPTSVVVVPNSPQIDTKPLIHPTTGLVISPLNAATSVIKPVPPASTSSGDAVVPQAAVIAAALLRDGYHNFQQQLRAQEIIKQQSERVKIGNNKSLNSGAMPTKILENFLRQQREQLQSSRISECDQTNDDLTHNDNDSTSDTNDGDDEEDDFSRYNGFDDIHLIEGSSGNKPNFGNSSLPAIFQTATTTSSSAGPSAAEYFSDESQKFMIAAQAQARVLRNFEYSLSDYGGIGENSQNDIDGGPEAVYECRHCGKKYRWKSTLRRHENVECGGKEPSHQCPYCPYKSKQRGNLGVHVRKHHSNLPQLASKRRSKYSIKLEGDLKIEGGAGGGNTSDDSSSRLIIDCSK